MIMLYLVPGAHEGTVIFDILPLFSTARTSNTCQDESKTCQNESKTCQDELQTCKDECKTCQDEYKTCEDQHKTRQDIKSELRRMEFARL